MPQLVQKQTEKALLWEKRGRSKKFLQIALQDFLESTESLPG